MIFSSQFFYVFFHPFDADHDPVLKMEKEFIYITGFRNGSAAECNSSQCSVFKWVIITVRLFVFFVA